jgi:hypothetical protein
MAVASLLSGAVLFCSLDKPLDLPLGQIFAAALANCYIYLGRADFRSREFSMEIGLPLVRTVTNLTEHQRSQPTGEHESRHDRSVMGKGVIEATPFNP